MAKCVKDSSDCTPKIMEVLIIEDPTHFVKFGFSGRYNICKHHADAQITACKYRKRIELDDNKEISYDERKELNQQWKSLCPKCGSLTPTMKGNLKGQPKWYFGFISESNGHRYATSMCSSCAKTTLNYLNIIFTGIDDGNMKLDSMMSV